jgi:acyl-coenzyme A synthetase/AMP-(fatty) acid ligase
MNIRDPRGTLPFAHKVDSFRKQLQSTKILTLCSAEHIDHIAAYIAWLEVGGNIFVKSALLPVEYGKTLDRLVAVQNCENSVIFHTSGTTGVPKLVIHTARQFQQAAKMATHAMQWNPHTKFLNFFPASTSGFWHIVIAPLVHHDATVLLGHKETVVDDLRLDANLVVLVPALIDQLRIRNAPVSLQKFSKVCSGASQVLPRHAQWCFDHGAVIFNHMYGLTESCSPILHRASSEFDEFVTYLDLTPVSDSEFRLVDGELHIKGLSLCEGSPEWLETNDLWEECDGKIRFAGRKNDIVKINGFPCSLLLVENTAEEKTDLGDTLAVVRNSMGSDWIELYYTNRDAVIDKKKFAKMFEPTLFRCNIPKKYTHIDHIPRTGLGKKQRGILDARS